MDEHEHDWGDARTVAPRTAQMCRAEGCTKWAVAWRKRWRPPTAVETVSLVAHMVEAVAIADAMIIVHGRERGLARAREALGYD